MENDDPKDVFIFPEGNDVNLTGGAGDYTITGVASPDVITISLSDDYSYDSYGTYNNNMASTTISPLSTSIGASGSSGLSGAVLTSSHNGTSWIGSSPTISVGGFENNASIHISGNNPKLKTDDSEIDINELASMVRIMKDMIDRNSIPLPDVTMLDKHEILQQSWEDVKQAYENYRITEALLKSTPPGDEDDQ